MITSMAVARTSPGSNHARNPGVITSMVGVNARTLGIHARTFDIHTRAFGIAAKTSDIRA
jgi:hypothetical protein